MQPVQMFGSVARFKSNAIVRFLLDRGGFDLNDLAAMEFSDDDQEQFAQLIGYSVDGFCDLPYVCAWHRELAEGWAKEAMSKEEFDKVELVPLSVLDDHIKLRKEVEEFHAVATDAIESVSKGLSALEDRVKGLVSTTRNTVATLFQGQVDLDAQQKGQWEIFKTLEGRIETLETVFAAHSHPAVNLGHALSLRTNIRPNTKRHRSGAHREA